MGRTPHTVEQMMSALNALASAEGTTEQLTTRVRQAFLDFGSETPDNVAALSAVQVSSQPTRYGEEIALTSIQSGLSLDEMAYALEDLDLPRQLSDRLPAMTQADWEAFMRITTLLYLALRAKSRGPQSD